MKTNQKGFANILMVIVVLVVLGVVGYFIAVKNSRPSTNPQQQSNGEESNQRGTILSFSVEPSTKVQGWVMYRDGAKAILKGKNIKSAEVRFYPTGTGITESSSAGKMQKISESAEGDIWEVKLPTLILATNFWVEAEGLDGKKIKSTDLGNVGYEEGKQTTTISQLTKELVLNGYDQCGVQFSNGDISIGDKKYTELEKTCSAANAGVFISADTIVFADLDGDGILEALVPARIVRASSGGALLVFKNVNGTARVIDSAIIGKENIKIVSVNKDTIVGKTDGAMNYTPTTQTYKFVNGKLIKQ